MRRMMLAVEVVMVAPLLLTQQLVHHNYSP
jgi:hypothetical protein